MVFFFFSESEEAGADDADTTNFCIGNRGITMGLLEPPQLSLREDADA